MKLLCLYLLLLLHAHKALGIITISPLLPEVNTSATISCYSVETGRSWYHKGLLKATCNNQRCLPSANPESGYTFTADNDKAQVTILSLNRTRDSGVWTCYTMVNQSIYFEAYAFPSGLYFTQGDDTDIDLAESHTILQCQTDGCVYPAPTIKWYFKDTAPSALRTFYNDKGTQVTGGSCTPPEELYTSRLVLPLYTTWQENIDKNVTLSCGIVYSDVARNVYSQESKQIRYAVRVTEAIMQHNNQNITNILNVTAGVPILMTCITGTSRPPATIIWLLGSQSRASGAIWNYTPSPADHNGIFYCQVYNTDSTQYIDSNKARLYVKDPPNIQLPTSPYKVIENQTLNVTCQVNSNPPADQIYWTPSGDGSISSILYINSVSRNNKGNYSCTAKNTMTPTYGGQQIGISIRQMEVDVLYPPSIQVMTNPCDVIENQTLDVDCLASGNPPPDNIYWTPSGEGSVSSRLYFSSVSRDKSGTYICTAQNIMVPSIGGKQTGMSTRQIKVDVQFAPEISVKITPYILEVNSEVRIECSAHGEPSSYKFYDWIHKLGNMTLRHIKGILVNPSTLGISFPSISIADMGTYICSVDNGIKGPDGYVQSMGTLINVIGVPVAFVSDAAFIGVPDMSVSIRIPFFSNPSLTDLKFLKTSNNAPIANDTDTHVYQTVANISTVFHNTDVVLQGMEAVLHFRALKESDFGQYTLVLYNNKGSATIIVHLKAFEPHTDVHVGPSIAGIAGGIGGSVFVIVVTGVVVWLWIRHNHTNKNADGTACAPTAETYEALQAKNNEASLYQELSDIKSFADNENSFRKNGTKSTENQSTYINTMDTSCSRQDQRIF